MRADLLALLDSTGKGHWINQYHGVIGGLHKVDVGLIFDGSNYRGIYFLQSSGTRFTLEGSLKENTISLLEYDSSDRHVGYITLNIEGSNMSGHWEDKKRSTKIPIDLHLSTKEATVNEPCAENAFLAFYQEGPKKTGSDLCLTSNPEKNSLVWYRNGVANHFISTLPGEYTAVPSYLDTLGMHVSLGKSQTDQNLTVTYSDHKGTKQILSFRQKSRLNYDCFDYAGYNDLVVVVKPIVTKAFNAWVDNILTGWLGIVLSGHENKSIGDLSASDRFANISTGWINVTYYENDIISGILTLQTPLQNSVQKKGFIYLLKEEKEVALNTIFKNSLVPYSVFENFVVRQNQPVSEIKNALSFDFFSLTPAGIHAETNFSTIYGEHIIDVPALDVAALIGKDYLSKFWSIK